MAKQFQNFAPVVESPGHTQRNALHAYHRLICELHERYCINSMFSRVSFGHRSKAALFLYSNYIIIIIHQWLDR